MALVEIVSPNLYTGARLQKMEVGAMVEVDDKTAERWKAAGHAKDAGKKAEKQTLEVATPGEDDSKKKGK